MNKRQITCITIFFVISIGFICIFFPEDVLARAGGGGGGGGGTGGGSGGSGGGLLFIILAPLFMLYSAFTTYLVAKKNKKCKSLLQQLSNIETSWDLNNIKTQIEVAYFKIQEAWMKRDQEIAKDYMSERLYTKHKIQTDQMLSEKRKNVLERINLKEAKIVEVADFKDDTKDRIWVHINGSMIDYIIDETTGKIVSGNDTKIEEFQELWKFIRGPKGWVLDEIDQKVDMSDITGFKAFSEVLK